MAFSRREKLSNDLGKILKERRVMVPLTLQQLSRASGVSSSHLGRIERGERFPSGSVLRKIARPLGSEESELFTLAGYLSPQPPSEAESEARLGQLDPHVAAVLSQEPVERQRAAVNILSVMKSMARGSNSDTSFAEYVRRKYPGVDEDLIIMMEDLLKRPPKGTKQ